MMGIDPKKMVSVIIASKNSASNMKKANMEGLEEMSESEESDDSVGYEAAADEILKAVEQKDPKALSEALMSFVHMCED